MYGVYLQWIDISKDPKKTLELVTCDVATDGGGGGLFLPYRTLPYPTRVRMSKQLVTNE